MSETIFMTNEELIEKYKSLHREKTGMELSDEEAFSQAMNLVALVKDVYKPIPSNFMNL